jgi:hypothetical protein
MTITLRQESQSGATTKSSSLTYAELDNNFIDLLTTKLLPIQIDADTGSVKVGQSQNNGVFSIAGGTNITTAVTEDSAGNANLTINGAGLVNIAEDTSPQLGGNLDVNGSKIITASGNANLKLSPHGTGVVEIEGDGASADGTIQLNCSQNSHGIKLASPPHSAGQSYTITFPSNSPNANDFMVSDADGDLKFTKLTAGTGITITNPDSGGDFVITNSASAGISDVVSDSSPQLGGNLDVNGNSIVSVSGADINITPDGSGKVVIDGLNYPQADGTAGEFLITDGSNNLSFARIRAGTGITVTNPDSGGDFVITNSASAGISDVVSDSTPQLGGDLESNGNEIKMADSTGLIRFNNTGMVLFSNSGDSKITSTQPVQMSLNSGATQFVITDETPNTVFKVSQNGVTELYHGTSKKFETASGGVSVTGTTTFNGTYNEKIHDATFNANFTPEPSDGSIQRITLTGSINFQGFATETDGASITLVITQDGTGGRTFTESLDSGNRMLFAGGTSTLSTAANAIDIMTITFIGGIYFASLSTNFS